MIQYITTLIDKYLYKPSPNEILDKFYISSYGLFDKRINVASYGWRKDKSYNMRNMIFRNLNDGTSESLGILLPTVIWIN